MSKKQKKKLRIDHWEYGKPVWTDIPLPKKERPRVKIDTSFRKVVDGQVQIFAEEVIKDTGKAFLIRIDGRTLWIPKFALPENERTAIAESDRLADMHVTVEFAIENGLIEDVTIPRSS